MSLQSTWQIPISLILACAVCLGAGQDRSAAAAGPTRSGQDASPTFVPGKETKVEDKEAGHLGYYLVYLPKKYSPERSWPVMVCYHGLNGKPTVDPFKQILGGEHYILIGMGFHQAGKEGYKHIKGRDVEILKRVLRSLHQKIQMNQDLLFVGGFSKGAFYAGSMLNNVPELRWAGGMLIGGGMSKPETPRREESLRKLPIFIGCGENDPHLDYAKIAQSHFKDMKADVTLEVWPHEGHVTTAPDSRAKAWLIANGPMRNAEGRLAKAKVYEKTDQVGKALHLYRGLADVDKADPICQQAGVAAAGIEAKVRDRMREADKALAEKDYILAQQLYSELAAEYEGCIFGTQAQEKLDTLDSDPAVRLAVAKAKTNRQANKLEARAKAAEKDGRYSEAIRLYEQYVWQYPQADGAEGVKKHLKKLRSDDSLQRRLKDQQAARDCRGWLSMADNFIASGNSEKAKVYLNKILRKYPKTTWALKAKVRMRNLD